MSAPQQSVLKWSFGENVSVEAVELTVVKLPKRVIRVIRVIRC